MCKNNINNFIKAMLGALSVDFITCFNIWGNTGVRDKKGGGVHHSWLEYFTPRFGARLPLFG